MISTPASTKVPKNPSGFDFHCYALNKAEGFDLLSYGPWVRRYTRWLVEVLGLKDERVLDVGCACGSMMRGLREAGALIDSVDYSEFQIELGREEWPAMGGGRLFLGDVTNLHFIPDATYDWLHSSVAAEYWKPELVPLILAELCRIVKPGGSFYCAYELGTVPTPYGCNPADELTYHCVKPATWWEDQLQRAGWELTSAEWAGPLHAHPDCLISEHLWAWFVARRPN